MQQPRIPEWFLRMREEAFKELSPYFGMELSEENIKAVEDRTNALIASFEPPVMHEGRIVQGITITKHPETQQIKVNIRI